MHSPFLRPDDPRYAQVLTDAAVRVLAERGVDGFSVGAIARLMNVTPQAVLKVASRARVIELVVICFGRRWLEWCRPGLFDDLPARLPQTPEEIHGVRVRVALAELARGELLCGRPAPDEHLRAFGSDELSGLEAGLRRSRGRLVTEEERQTTAALVTGLRIALAESEPTLTWETACSILRDHAEGRTLQP